MAVRYIDETEYEIKMEWLTLSIIFGVLLFFFTMVTFISIFAIIVRVYNIDGYNIVLSGGVLKDTMIIEDVVFASEFDSIFHVTYLDGKLPNERKFTQGFVGAIRLETKSFYER